MARQIPQAASGILSYFTRHRTIANLLFVSLIIAGLAALPNMRTQFFPDVILDKVTVSTNWDAAGPEEVDRAIVQLLEPALLAVEGVESSASIAREGWSRITLSFEPDWDMSRAADDVQSAVDAVTELPEDADEPEVRRTVWRDRVTDVVISGPVAPEQLAQFADELVVRLFAAGVTRTTIRGVAAPRTLVEVPSARLIAHDISMAEIAAAIAAEADTDPAGDVSGSNARVRTGVEKRAPDQIADIVLRSEPNGAKLRIGDLATVSREGSDRERSYLVGVNPAISVRVDRSARGDAVGIQATVEDVAEKLEATLPDGVTIELIRTRAAAITGRLDILIDNGLIGLGLVVCLLFLFLNARTAFWVAAGIPVAMMAAISLMYAAGITLNMISLFGLIITLGIVVDDAIVVGEHADHRARRFNETPYQAAENAARRMAMPVFAATLTTVIAFFGLVAIGGRFGLLIRDIPLTVIAVLVASLIECFLILPNHMAHALAAQAKERWYDWPSRQVNRGFRWARETLFRPLMAGVIRARYVVLAGVVAILASQVAIFIRGDVQWRFFNAPERSSVTGNFAMVDGSTRQDTLEMTRELQRATAEVAAEYEARYGLNPVEHVLSEVGGTTGRGLDGMDIKDKDLLGAISIQLIDADLRPYSSFAFVGDLQERVVNHPLTEVVSFRGWRSGPGGDALSVRLSGGDTDTLKAASLDLQNELRQYPEVSALQDNLSYDKEELILDLTAQGQALGFTIDDLGRVLRNRLGGIEAATYPDGPRSATIDVELPAGELTADFLDRTQLRTPAGEYVPLADIVSVQRRIGFSTVRRENGIRTISVTGDISEDNPARAAEIQQALEQQILPRIASEWQIEWQLAGLAEQEDTFLNEAMTGLILCLSGIYLVLAWVFGSWTRPMVVMAIIPFGLVGTIYGHVLWDVPLSMFTVVGLLGMTGIIINDSIVLITTIDEYAQDRGLIPSIIEGTSDRLRPVMLTTMTTVLGMAPLLYEGSRQAQFLKPTIITLVYGLGFGMLLVLLVVPALVAAQHDIARQMNAMRRGLTAPVAGIKIGFAALWALILCWCLATLGWVLWYGALPETLAVAFPAVTQLSALLAALLLFLSGVVVIVLGAYGFTAAALFARRARRQA
ncbi:efflux RND transporter permease subunit [uncultured Roseobacter sp.]|uniref:efflux RND transporter permease subunit n=1 Tax=uncultured Roseobacter sp. TaxID=114847 RepID=UPI00263A26AC|nr:efflux RND transporter permease subunit [uncultured Roseobacter sp.]